MEDKSLFVMKKMTVFALMIAVTWTSTFQKSAQAMLVPATAYPTVESPRRSEDLATIQKTLESKAIRGKLQAMGLSDAEIQSRLSRMSDEQIHQMAQQIRAVHPAGDIVVGLLVIVLLVVLIIYLVKRI